MNRIRGVAALAVSVLFLGACGDDGPVEPNIPREDVVGTYRLTQLSFDPLGILPAADIHQRLADLDKPDASLNLLPDGTLQLFFEDPSSPLLRLVPGSFRTTPTGVAISFESGSAYGALVLPRRSTYEVSAGGSLVLEDSTTVSRSALLALVPEWQTEQLLDPVPGELLVVFDPAP